MRRDFRADLARCAGAIVDDELLRQVVKTGTEKALASAEKTIKEVREAIGFRKF
jgi:hypothetical protein